MEAAQAVENVGDNAEKGKVLKNTVTPELLSPNRDLSIRWEVFIYYLHGTIDLSSKKDHIHFRFHLSLSPDMEFCMILPGAKIRSLPAFTTFSVLLAYL